MSLLQTTFTVLDFETTGKVDGYLDEPWQIGLVQIKDGKIDQDSMYSGFLYIGDRPFNRYAPGRHEQLREKLRHAPKLRELWPELSHRLLEIPLVAQNISTEKKILHSYFPLHKFGPWIDTLKISRSIFPQATNHKLESIITYYNFQNKLDQLCVNREYHDAGTESLY